MKTPTSPSPISSGARAVKTYSPPSALARDSAYLSVAQTHALLADSLAARRARLAAEDLLSTDEAARLVGTTRVTINAWIDKGRCIALSQSKRGYRLPDWQFEPRLWPVVPELARALQTKDGWQLLNFLETPLGALDGATPRAAIEQGQSERVLAIAGQEGT